MPAEPAPRLATPASRMTRKLGLAGESVALWSMRCICRVGAWRDFR